MTWAHDLRVMFFYACKQQDGWPLGNRSQGVFAGLQGEASLSCSICFSLSLCPLLQASNFHWPADRSKPIPVWLQNLHQLEHVFICLISLETPLPSPCSGSSSSGVIQWMTMQRMCAAQHWYLPSRDADTESWRSDSFPKLYNWYLLESGCKVQVFWLWVYNALPTPVLPSSIFFQLAWWAGTGRVYPAPWLILMQKKACDSMEISLLQSSPTVDRTW